MTTPRLALCGKSLCGKDTVAAYISSVTALRFEKTTSDVLADYVGCVLRQPPKIAFSERDKQRKLWKDIGDQLRNEKGPDFLIREALKTSDIIVGVRARSEMLALRQMDILTIWIERDGLVDPTVEYIASDCDLVIYNNSTLKELERRLDNLCRLIRL